jgi:hypothetical protein
VRPPHASDVPVICVSPSGDNEFGRRRVVLNNRATPKSKDLRSPGRRILQDAEDGEQNGSHKQFPATHGLKFKCSLCRRATETGTVGIKPTESTQQSAIADTQFVTSLTRYPYQSTDSNDKDIERAMLQIADWRLLIARIIQKMPDDAGGIGDNDRW